MTRLSARQQSILDYIRQQVRKKGYPPSVREIGEAVGLASSSTVHGHLERLEKKGYIRRDPTKPRAIELLDDTTTDDFDLDYVRIPVVGKVTAGEPITAVENIEDYFPLPKRLAAGNVQLFMLKVSGDSMINAGILDNDYVIVRQQASAQNGDVVVALTEDGEATVKRFQMLDDHVRLIPENDSMEPIELDEVTILGKVIGVYRHL